MTWLDDRLIDGYEWLGRVAHRLRSPELARWCYWRRLAAERRHCKRGGWRLW